MKRTRENTDDERYLKRKTHHSYHSIGVKRKLNTEPNCNKRQHTDSALADAKRENIELRQTLYAFAKKIETLEYMLRMFQRNETVCQHKIIHAY